MPVFSEYRPITVKKVMSELQDMDESHYYMITQLDAKKAAQAANGGAK